MKFDWQQLSPRERDALLRHFLMQRNMDAPVSVEKVCAALHSTHQLSCVSDANGKTVVRFVTMTKGIRPGKSVSSDFAEGIYKAALRAKGVEVDDGLSAATLGNRTRSARLARS